MNVTTLILLRLIARNSTAALSPQKKVSQGRGRLYTGYMINK